MLPLLIASAHLLALAAPRETWYGPVGVNLTVPTSGNPYDPETNDVEVTFERAGKSERRIAFYNGTGWQCRFLTQTPGSYHVAVWLNGKEVEKLSNPLVVRTLQSEPFVRIDNNRFVLGDGKPFWPVGHSLAWTDTSRYKSLAEQLPEMGRTGVTWTRIWATFWDNRNPYWVASGPKPQDGAFSQEALSKWDEITRAAEQAGVRFQWTLHHHGQVSTTVNPNWQDHPWNVKNGGFLEKAEDFFTNPEAKRRTKAYLRYIVARYADSPAIMAWELFNEVQFSDAAQKGHWDTVAAWHNEMATYVRSIDPYHHLITTSSEIGKPIWDQMDYYQAHGYPPSIPAMVLGDKPPKNKPYFWGEVGGPSDNSSGANEHLVVRDAIWSGVLAGNSGSAEYWNWDRMGSPHMYDEFKIGSEIVKESGFLSQAALRSEHLHMRTGAGSPLKFSPGMGWAPSTISKFNLPADATPETMGRFSSFLQGKAHPEMSKPTASFTFEAPKPGVFKFRVDGVSAGGTSLNAQLDGQQVKNETFAAGDRPRETWSIPFSTGRHTVTLNNTGGDWVTLSGFSVDGIGPAVTGSVIGNDHWALMRLTRGSTETSEWGVEGLSLADGAYKLTEWDLDTGASVTATVKVAHGRLEHQQMAAKDAILVFRKS